MDDVIVGGGEESGEEREDAEGGGRKEEDQGRQAPPPPPPPHAAPGIHLDPRPLLTSKGHGATQPFILIMEEVETVSHNMALLLCHAACHLPSPSTAITQESAPASSCRVLMDAGMKV